MSKLMKNSEFTDDQSNKVIALWEKFGLTRSWNNPQKDTARKNSDKKSKFLIGSIDEALMPSIMIGYDRQRCSINYIAVLSRFHGNKLW